MYIRRKVFSKIGEKTFSTTEFQTQKEFAAKKDEESKKEKIHKKSNAVYAAGVGTGLVGAGILGKTTGKASGTKEAVEEYLRGTDSYKEGVKQDKEASKAAKELKKEVKDYQKKVLNSKNIKLKDKAKMLINLEKRKKDINNTYNSLKNSTERAVKEVGNSEAKKYLKGNKKSLALGVGASAIGAGLVGKSIKMREKEDLKVKKKDQKEFAAKKEESKKEKVAKAATIGGATVGLGAGAVGLGAEVGRKKVEKKIAENIKKVNTPGNGIKARKATQEAIDKLKKGKKVLEKVSKHAPKAALAGVGASVAAGTAYKLARKKKDEKK